MVYNNINFDIYPVIPSKNVFMYHKISHYYLDEPFPKNILEIEKIDNCIMKASRKDDYEDEDYIVLKRYRKKINQKINY